MRLREYFRIRRQKHIEKERYILSIDGGGMRGVIPATILAHIEDMFLAMGDDRPLISHFDLIAGTSSGGLTALALTAPPKKQPTPNSASFTSKQIVDFYLTYGKTIFPVSQSIFQLNKFNQLFSHKYDDKPFNRLLYDIFGNILIQEALAPVMVVTYDCTDARPFVLSSDQKAPLAMRIAARATSAAPTYFPSIQVDDPDRGHQRILIDGGVAANNPVLYAYREAKRLYPDAKRFHVLSLGTGSSSVRSESEKALAGVMGWMDPAKGTPLHRVYASSQMHTAHELASVIADLVYVRIDGDIGEKVKLDETDPVVLGRLISTADRIFASCEQQITSFCRPLVERTGSGGQEIAAS